jgi:Cu-Zn family superoxide dismutase
MRMRLAKSFLLLSVAACGGADTAADSTAAADTSGATTAADSTGPVSVVVRDSSGRELGTLTVAESGGAVTASGTLRGLPPGIHGVHFHMVGMCDAPFTTAGEHWNPTGKQHGKDNPNGPHVGDLLNIEVGADSSVNIQLSAAGGTMHGTTGLHDADGGAFIVHANADDNKTDPSGNSGARIACGKIGG